MRTRLNAKISRSPHLIFGQRLHRDCGTILKALYQPLEMPGPSNTLLIEGSFSELSDELAQFIDGVAKPEESAALRSDIKSEIEQLQQIEQSEDPQSVDQSKVQQIKDEILKKIVTKASGLNSAPEKGRLSMGLEQHLSNIAQSSQPRIISSSVSAHSPQFETSSSQESANTSNNPLHRHKPTVHLLQSQHSQPSSISCPPTARHGIMSSSP